MSHIPQILEVYYILGHLGNTCYQLECALGTAAGSNKFSKSTRRAQGRPPEKETVSSKPHILWCQLNFLYNEGLWAQRLDCQSGLASHYSVLLTGLVAVPEELLGKAAQAAEVLLREGQYHLLRIAVAAGAVASAARAAWKVPK